MKVAYEKAQVAINVVILTIKDGMLWVYLDRREKEPFEGLHELPGGLLVEGETAEKTLARKLKDVTGINNVYFQQFCTFTQPERDPRGRTVSIGFVALVSSDKVDKIEKFVAIDRLPKLAFDHRGIVGGATEYLNRNLSSLVVRQFMPRYFPLNDLQMVCEVIGGERLDNRNFRKRMLASGDVRQVKRVQEKVAHRPATLYEFV